MISPKLLNRRIGLSLSGGGVRAVAFHAGVLQWFAERELLGNIEHISSVSGGSLFTGLVFHLSGNQWPASTEYINHIYPDIRDLLTTKSLQGNALCRLLLNPINWRFLLSRANIVSQSIERYWDVSEKLERLPSRPVWSINGTTAETGRRFRFKDSKIGDYEIGYADSHSFKLAVAMAVSAAFPGGIGPLKLDATLYTWFRRNGWNLTQPLSAVNPKFNKLHLYDGGVYDNLGLESLFDVGKQSMKNDTGSPAIDFLVVSDAGAPFSRSKIPGPLNPWRLKRVAEIAFDQARALRVRAFVNFLKGNTASGMYLQIGSNPIACIKEYGNQAEIKSIATDSSWLSAPQITAAASYRTSLSRMKKEDFDLIARHGYETILWNELAFYNDQIK